MAYHIDKKAIGIHPFSVHLLKKWKEIVIGWIEEIFYDIDYFYKEMMKKDSYYSYPSALQVKC